MALTDAEQTFLATARTATLATISPDGRPRLVPVCFVLLDDRIWTPIDEKPKASAHPTALARVRDIARRGDVTLLIERWDEDWTRLGWLRIDGHAMLVEPDPGTIRPLRDKYPQYAGHDLEHRPLIRIDITGTASWGDLSDRGRSPSPSAGGSGSSSSPGGSRRR